MRPAAQTASLPLYLSELWQRRAYIQYVASSQLRSQQMHTMLGNLWHLLNPALQIAVSYVIFGLVLSVDRGVEHFISFLTVGIFVFQFTQRATMLGAKSVVGNLALMKSFAFPRAMLPLTSCLSSTLSHLPTVPIMLLVAVLAGDGARWAWLAVPLIVALQVVFNIGAAFVAARLTFLMPDIEQLLPFVFRLLYYGSGVLFLVDAYVEGSYRWLFIGNPLYCVISLHRWAILGFDIDPAVAPALVIWSLGLTVIGFVWFRRGEGTFGRG